MSENPSVARVGTVCGGCAVSDLNIVSTGIGLAESAHTLKADRFYFTEEIMPVLRKNKKDNYTVIDNHVFMNKNLSFKAKGLLCQMLSLPDNWNYSLEGLVALANDGISSVRSALKELENQMYFKRRRLYEDGKLAGVEYIVSETPMCENLILENLKQENLNLENQAQLNTNTIKTRKESNKKSMYDCVPDYLKDAFMEWAEMRKKIKKPIPSEKSVTRSLNNLYGLTKDKGKQIAIIEQATDKNWLSFYPLREDKQEQPRSRAYKAFEPEPEIEAEEMPDYVRENYNRFMNGL